VHPNDPSRVQRALEVYYAAGRPLSAYHREQPFGEVPPQVLMLGYAWERAVLYERINARVQAMLDAGWIEEVRALLGRGYDPHLKPLRAIGYREIVALLRGERDAAHLARDIAQRTRHYAKRQLTWFRRMPAMVWAPPEDTGALLARARDFLRQVQPPE
jgi:tRNA dimethylallyltransferase